MAYVPIFCHTAGPYGVLCHAVCLGTPRDQPEAHQLQPVSCCLYPGMMPMRAQGHMLRRCAAMMTISVHHCSLRCTVGEHAGRGAAGSEGRGRSTANSATVHLPRYGLCTACACRGYPACCPLLVSIWWVKAKRSRVLRVTRTSLPPPPPPTTRFFAVIILLGMWVISMFAFTYGERPWVGAQEHGREGLPQWW